MVALVSLQDAQDHIRTDSGADDRWLNRWIPMVSAAVLSWLKEDWRAYEVVTDAEGAPVLDSNGDGTLILDTDGAPIVKAQVEAAVLLELAQQYRFRDGSDAAAVPSHWGHGYVLGAGATSMLVALRKSTVA